MIIPLFNRLKRRHHVEIALLQDEIVSIIYSLLPNAVLHGGTAIWRCYKGNRFSEDLDFYAPNLPKDFNTKFSAELGKRDLELIKFKKTENTVFSKISNRRVEARLEIALRNSKKKIVVQYEKVDGSFFSIFSLSPEDLIKEKISAYLSRRFVRDLYDICYLSGIATDFEKIKNKGVEFMKAAKAPVDEKTLKTLVYSGIAPTSKQMFEVLQRRFGA